MSRQLGRVEIKNRISMGFQTSTNFQKAAEINKWWRWTSAQRTSVDYHQYSNTWICVKRRGTSYTHALDKQETPGMRHSFEWYFRVQFSVTTGQEINHLEHVSDMTVTGHFMWRIVWSQKSASGKHLMKRKNGFLKPILLTQWIAFGQCLSRWAFLRTFELSRKCLLYLLCTISIYNRFGIIYW